MSLGGSWGRRQAEICLSGSGRSGEEKWWGCGERVVHAGAARGSDSAHGSGGGKTGRCWAALWRIRGSWMRTREGMGKNTPRASRILRIRKWLGQDMRSGGDATRGCWGWRGREDAVWKRWDRRVFEAWRGGKRGDDLTQVWKVEDAAELGRWSRVVDKARKRGRGWWGGGLDGAGSSEWLVASREEGDDGGGMVVPMG